LDPKSTKMADQEPTKFPLFEELNRLFFEYLELNGMGNTLSSFISECNTKKFPCPAVDDESNSKSISTFTQGNSENLIQSFEEGNLERFMELWQDFLSHIQITSDDMKKLEVYIRVHFAIWPKANGKPEEEQLEAMNKLKAFFEENSGELSNDSTVLPLFALPYVAEPMAHPIFNELFKPMWSLRLKRQLEATLAKYFELLQENIGFQSKLAAVVLKSHNLGDLEKKSSVGLFESLTLYHKERFLQLMSTYRKTRKLLRGTRESDGKLLKVSNELISGLEAAVAGESVVVESVVQRCFDIFPELFTPDVILNGRPDKEYFKKLTGAAIFDTILDSDVSLFFIGISDLSPDCLNYPKIKDRLASDEGGQSERLCLVQALRWLLTKCSAKCRQLAMDSFVAADLLGLQNSSKEYREQLFSCMTCNNPTYFKECFSRLLNAFACMKTGRDYMACSTFLLDTLVNSLVTFKGQNESYICQMVVATLQKMSLRKQMRLEMIQRNVIQWLVSYLKTEIVKKGLTDQNDNPELLFNPYLMEYGWALLMNLCLHEEAKPLCSIIAPDILTCVVQMLLCKPSKDVAPYVVSTLYSLLRNPDIYAMAKRMRLQDTFADIVATDKSEMATHLGQLVDILNLKGYDRLTANGEVEYDDDDNTDPDEFEPELEVSEAWVASLDLCNQTGDDLLIRHYLVHRGEPVVPSPPTPKGQQRRGVLLRPTTPSKSIPLATASTAKLPQTVEATPVRTNTGTKPKRAPSKRGLKPKETNTSTVIEEPKEL